jgi:molybdopterin synthase catalytic subunit
MIEIVSTPIDVQAIIGSVHDPRAGAVDLFLGTTRNQTKGRDVLWLEYEAFEPMARELMERIAREARERWGTTKIAIVHRIGRVEVGEVSVAIAVSSPHRNEAFLACRYVIDTLKKTVPIWKKEVFADGGEWVGMEKTSK